MATPEALSALETTPANNDPKGTTVIGATLDDELRDIKANVARAARDEATATISGNATLPATMLNKIQPVNSFTAGAAVTITLPPVATTDVTAGWGCTLVNIDGAQNIVVAHAGSAVATLSATLQAAKFVSDGTSYFNLDKEGSQSVVTTEGDIIVADNAGVDARLAIGTAAQLLKVNAGATALEYFDGRATQAEMESASQSAVYVTPKFTHNHPGVSKCWGQFDGSNADIPGTFVGYNVTTIVDNGAGSYTVTIATDFASDRYAVTVNGRTNSGATDAGDENVAAVSLAAGSFRIDSEATGGSNTDSGNVAFACFGDHA